MGATAGGRGQLVARDTARQGRTAGTWVATVTGWGGVYTKVQYNIARHKSVHVFITSINILVVTDL